MTTTRTYIGKARKKMLAKKNIELVVLPSKAALEEHVKRADYWGITAVITWRQALLPVPELGSKF